MADSELLSLVFRISNDGRDININVAPSSTIAEVKNLLRSNWPDADVPTAPVKLLLGGRFLADAATVASLKIQPHSTIAVVKSNGPVNADISKPQVSSSAGASAPAQEETPCCSVM